MKKFFSLQNLIYFSIIAIPAYAIKFYVIGLPTNVFEVLVFLVVMIFFIKKKNFKLIFSGCKPYFLPVAMILVGLVASTLLNEDYRSGFGAIKSWFIFPLLFPLVALAEIKSESYKKIYKAIYFSSFLASCVAITYFFLDKITFDGRLQAFYNSPNFLAMYIAPAVLIGVALFHENRKLYGISLAVILAVLYLTFSYASWAALILASVALFFSRKGKFWKPMAALFVILLIFAGVQLSSKKMTSLIHLEQRSSAASRIIIWSSASRIIKDNWLFGIGPNQFQNKYLEYQKYFPPYLEWSAPQPHNLFLAFWLQAGIIGLLGFLALIIVWFKNVLIMNKNAAISISISIMIYILAHGLLDTTYFKPDLAVIFWLNFFIAIKKHP